VGLARSLPDRADLVALRIGPSAWVTIPGELETALGREIKAAARPAFTRVVLAGLTNDYVGYLLTPEVWRRPSYIACASVYGPDGGRRVRDAALAVLGRLGGRLAPSRRRPDGARGRGLRRGRPGGGPARTSCGRPCSGGARPC
jgi:neutral ceramidase